MNSVQHKTVFAAPAANDGYSGPVARFNALGIPVDNLDMKMAVDRIVDMIYGYPRDKVARYVATVNVDFMVNSLGVAGNQARHPELLEILRSADMVTADGFPVVMLSRMMGTPLCGRVTGADLVPALADRFASEGLRLYFLGGREEIAREAASILEARYPGLEIVGVESPMVHTEGEALLSYEDDDERIVDDINRSGADVLLLGLGNPKQEQWFRRHRERLKVPVSIGVGGTFEFIAGTVKRAPAWLQRNNLEWLFRITQDPRRLWKRYAEGLVKLGLLVSPLLLMRAKDLLFKEVSLRPGTSRNTLRWTRFTGPNQSSAVSVKLPKTIRRDDVEQVLQRLASTRRNDTLHVIDLSGSRRIEIVAMQGVFELGRLLSNGKTPAVYIGMQRGVRKQLRRWRLIDLFDRENLTAASLHESLASQPGSQGLPLRFYATDAAMVVYLHGRVDSESLRRSGLQAMLAVATQQQKCIIDLRFAELVESSAIAVFHRMAVEIGDTRLCFAGVGGSVRRMFKLARVPRELRFISDSEEQSLLAA